MEKRELEQKKEMLIALMSDKEYKAMKQKEISGLLQVPKEEREELRVVLDSLMSEGKIVQDEKGRYKLLGSDQKPGVYSGTTRGYGFVTLEEGGDDVFIPENDTNGALHKDKVLISLKEGNTGKRREGVILKVLEHETRTLVGTYQKNKNFGFVVSDNLKLGSDIYIPLDKSKGAVTGHKVVVEITSYGDGKSNPEGVVLEIIGHINDPGVDIACVIRSKGLPTEFSEEVMKQVELIQDEITEEDRKGRLDLRSLPTVTIDGEDAKDLDDAISVSKEAHGYTLGVHIADVSHYVTESSPLDKEALKRGTSVYLVDRVIPMLPHKLSNGICSLNADCDRLALSCIMDIDEKGNVIGHRIVQTVIRVDHRMTYTSVKKIVDDRDEDECKKYESFVPMFEMMNQLALILRAKRRKRGSIDFDFPESKITVDAKGVPLEIKAYERNEATKIIEDFMLIANETVAEDFFWQELPFVYRTHETPDPEKILKLGILINNFGYSIRTGQEEIHPKELQKLLDKVENTPEEPLISRLTLRSMKQARYSPACEGHFGLAAKYYCHFTSPIRRYPDLQIHRIISERLSGEMSEKRVLHYEKILTDISKQASMTERRAEEAEREVQDLKKVEYMSNYIGDIFEGVISSVTSWGLYVELPNTVEGRIHITELNDDFYLFDEMSYSLIGEHSKKIYKLGQRLKIIVSATDKLLRTIDFIPAPEEE